MMGLSVSDAVLRRHAKVSIVTAEHYWHLPFMDHCLNWL